MTSVTFAILYLTFIVCIHATSVRQIPTTKQSPETMNLKIKMESDIVQKELYRFSFTTDDGSYREEVATLLNPGTDEEELVVTGAYGYVRKDLKHTVTYTVNKNGYQPHWLLKPEIDTLPPEFEEVEVTQNSRKKKCGKKDISCKLRMSLLGRRSINSKM